MSLAAPPWGRIASGRRKMKFDTLPNRSIGFSGVRVLHIISSVDPRLGGPVEGVFSSAEVWYSHGHERHIVSLDPPSAPWLAAARAPTEALGLGGSFYSILRRFIPWLRYGYTPRLVPWLHQHAGEYDAVIVNGIWNYSSFGAWRALHEMKVPYFIFTHGMLARIIHGKLVFVA